MNRFIIVDGLPYLYAAGKAYAVRWDSAGFTVGAEIELKTAPDRIYNELSIKAQCAGNLDSIGAAVEKEDPEPEPEPEQEPEKEEMPEPEPEPAAKKKTRGRKKTTAEADGET